MRVIVFFDLPVTTAGDLKEYRTFRKNLIKSGFLMEQESVYSKLAANGVAADSIIENLKKNRPKEGVVQILKITEKQYTGMEFIVGKKQSCVLDTEDRLVIL